MYLGVIFTFSVWASIRSWGNERIRYPTIDHSSPWHGPFDEVSRYGLSHYHHCLSMPPCPTYSYCVLSGILLLCFSHLFWNPCRGCERKQISVIAPNIEKRCLFIFDNCIVLTYACQVNDLTNIVRFNRKHLMLNIPRA